MILSTNNSFPRVLRQELYSFLDQKELAKLRGVSKHQTELELLWESIVKANVRLYPKDMEYKFFIKRIISLVGPTPQGTNIFEWLNTILVKDEAEFMWKAAQFLFFPIPSKINRFSVHHFNNLSAEIESKANLNSFFTINADLTSFRGPNTPEPARIEQYVNLGVPLTYSISIDVEYLDSNLSHRNVRIRTDAKALPFKFQDLATITPLASMSEDNHTLFFLAKGTQYVDLDRSLSVSFTSSETQYGNPNRSLFRSLKSSVTKYIYQNGLAESENSFALLIAGIGGMVLSVAGMSLMKKRV